MSVNETCVSLAASTLSPDLRVNYAYGMVLGLDEFVQEQRHRLGKSELRNRALHGYGTAYGLQVTAEPVAEGASDVVLRVAPGMGIDQAGREVVVRCAQCAHLGAWLAAQVEADPTVLQEHAGVSGEHTVYVVASYVSCLDNLVPLPGAPCSSSSQNAVASRVRDAWDIDLRWEPPAMPRWDSDRRLARLLDAVEIVPGLDPLQSGKEDLLAAVLSLPAEAASGPSELGTGQWPPHSPSGGPSGPLTYRLPGESAADDLDDVLTVWVTQVRPLLEPDLTEPEQVWDPAFLLASFTFTVPDPFDPAAPLVTSWDEPDDSGRPYLLHTHLIQELRGAHGAAGVADRDVELVTLSPMVAENESLQLGAWFHLERPVQLTAPVQVVTESGDAAAFEVAAIGGAEGFSDRWRLSAPEGFEFVDGEQLAAVFDGSELFVGDESTTLDDLLGGAEGAIPLGLLNITPAGDVVAYTRIEVPAQVPVPPDPPAIPPPQPSVEFVTITSQVVEGELIRFELWFHTQPSGEKDDVRVMKLSEESLRGFDEVTGNPLTPVSPQGGPNPEQDGRYPDLWRWVVRRTDDLPAYVRLLFSTKEVGVDVQGGGVVPLGKYIAEAKILFIGWDRDADQVVAFHRVEGKVPQ